MTQGYNNNGSYSGTSYGNNNLPGAQGPNVTINNIQKVKETPKSKRKTMAMAQRKEYAKVMYERKKIAESNSRYRRVVADMNKRGKGIDNSTYRLPDDRKPAKEKDYFFIMRKSVSFIMCLIFLVSIAYFALGVAKVAALPEQFTALFMETEAKEADPDDAQEGGEEDEIVADNADEDDATAEGGEEGDEEGEGDEKANAFDGITYSATDPIFGFIKYVGSLLKMELNFGESPLYDTAIAKAEVGMADSMAQNIALFFPVAIIIYIITAVILFIKAFFGMFGKRIFKCFGLGSIVMIICAVVTALGGLALTVDVAGKMDFAGVVNILIGGVTGVGGFTGGYGLLIILVLPIITLILSMFARKKIPYSIFDTYGE